MDKEKIIRQLKKISEHAVHVTGEPPFILSLDDGIALNEAVSLLKEQEPIKPEWRQGKAFCGSCGLRLPMKRGKRKPFCPSCGMAVKWE